MASLSPDDADPARSWWRWGDPATPIVLPDALRRLLTETLGLREAGRRPRALDEIELPASRLPAEATAKLTAAVGAAHALSQPADRIRHTLGKSTPDLLRLRAGDVADAPDIVLLPGSHDEVLSLLALCSEMRVAVVPFGGGTSVVGGLEPEADRFTGVVALDLARMNALLALDEESRLATLEPGLIGPRAEQLLAARGYTIGHFPQSFEFATIGGFAATRSSGQASAGYGRFDDMVVALRVATPVGTLELGRAPKSAAGPDLRQLILGSEGALGVITSVAVQVRPVPAQRVYEGWRFPSFVEGAAALRRLVQDGPVPTVLRLSDEIETGLSLGRPPAPGASSGALAIVGYEGSEADVAARRPAVAQALRSAGADEQAGAGEAWVHDRYAGPYLRDALLDAGVFVETLETAAFWSSLRGLYSAVSRALRDGLTAGDTPPIVMCHISHVYPSGASLYFTVAAAQLEDQIARWRRAKAAAGDAILAAGASITHHHGVGRDHREWYEREVGPLAITALGAVKAKLDPAGVLNPGILLPL